MRKDTFATVAKKTANSSNLILHSQVHVIERKFKCEPCQVSFHSQGHLQKHKRSGAHEARVQMTQAFGVPTSDNPRPYGCSECDTAFRKHGHLAKHLRSKSHITRLESKGLIPSGTYAALEKCGQDLKIVTANYEQSLICMREIAIQLFQDQIMVNETPPSYPTSEPMRGIIDSNMMTNYPSSMSAQPQSILSPTYFINIHAAASAGASCGLHADVGREHHATATTTKPPPSSPKPMFHQQHYQRPSPGLYLNESPGSRMMVTNMTPHPNQTHSLDYTMRCHHYDH